MPRPTKLKFPNGARMAVVFMVVLEDLGQDLAGQSMWPKLPEELVKQGRRDMLRESWERYAPEVGIWRLIDVLDKHGIPAVGAFSGKSAHDHPDVAKAFMDGAAGREIVAHSWTQDLMSFALSEEDMRANVQRCTKAIESATGVRPVGWLSPAAMHTAETIDILAEEGYSWHGDYLHSHTADIATTRSGKKMVRQMISWENNDYQTYARHHLPPSAYVEMYERAFDMLYEEGGQICQAHVHADIYGNPFGAWAFSEIIRYAKSKPDVWITNRREVADWVLKQSDACPTSG